MATLALAASLLLPSMSQAQAAAAEEKTEETWILREVILDLAEMINLPAGKPLADISLSLKRTGNREAPDRSYQASLTMPGLPKPVQVSLQPEATYVWDPALYRPLASSLLSQLKLKPTPTSPDPGMAERLLTLRPETLQAENKRLSAALEKEPLSPQLHEEAALLVAAFLYKELAWMYEEKRYQMNRLTAHLALAEALSPDGKLSLTGQLAREISATMIQRSQPNLSGFESAVKAHPDAPGLAAWYRALLTRSTMHPEQIADPDKASTAEQLAFLDALSQCDRKEEALEFLRRLGEGITADHTRPLLMGSLHIGIGHSATQVGLATEIRELAHVWQLITESQPPENLAPQELLQTWILPWLAKQEPRRAVHPTGEVHVLGDGLWANFAQRHLFYVLERNHYFLEKSLSVPDAARDFVAMCQKTFGQLPQYPMLQLNFVRYQRNKNEQTYRNHDAVVEQLLPLTERNPEQIPFPVFTHMTQLDKHKYPVPAYASWYHYRSPAGTGYNHYNRKGWLPGKKATKAFIMENWKRNPDDVFLLLDRILIVENKNPKPETLALLQGHHLLKSPRLTRKLINLPAIEKNEKLYLETLSQLCESQPFNLFNLGEHYAVKGETKLARQTFLKALNLMKVQKMDLVAGSNRAFRAIVFFERAGEPEIAEEFANAIQGAGSYAAYRDMGLFLERQGRHEEAVPFFRQIATRYRDQDELLSFYLRREHEGEPLHQQEFKSLTKSIFPQGMQPIELSSLKGRPKKGVRMRTRPGMREEGLPPAAIVVGIDGIAVATKSQFYILALGKRSDSITLQYFDPKTQSYGEVTLKESIKDDDRLTDNPRRILSLSGAL